jgi:antitoxin (DNA-binding transcriptional repressor) of toxin-antitoxin stability system
MIMKETISTNELRFEFKKVLKALSQGKEISLTYRNKLIAYILPAQIKKEFDENDPFFSVSDISEPMGNLTNSQIDQYIYD